MDKHESIVSDLLISNTNSGFLIKFTQKRNDKLEERHLKMITFSMMFLNGQNWVCSIPKQLLCVLLEYLNCGY